MTSRRFSKQRQLLAEIIHKRKDHPTAEVLHQEILKVYPKMSLGTVYRNLMVLTDLGEVNILNPGDGHQHFDPNTRSHAHFFCDKCHKVYDLERVIMPGLDTPFHDPDFKGKVFSSDLIFHGLCNECCAQEKQKDIQK